MLALCVIHRLFSPHVPVPYGHAFCEAPESPGVNAGFSSFVLIGISAGLQKEKKKKSRKFMSCHLHCSLVARLVTEVSLTICLNHSDHISH